MDSNIDKIGYKIECGKKYFVNIRVWNGKKYYNIKVQQKNMDNSTTTYYKPINFRKGVELPILEDGGCTIIIHSGVENLRENPKDKYNPISSIAVFDYEIVSPDANYDVERKFLDLKVQEEYLDNLPY